LPHEREFLSHGRCQVILQVPVGRVRSDGLVCLVDGPVDDGQVYFENLNRGAVQFPSASLEDLLQIQECLVDGHSAARRRCLENREAPAGKGRSISSRHGHQEPSDGAGQDHQGDARGDELRDGEADPSRMPPSSCPKIVNAIPTGRDPAGDALPQVWLAECRSGRSPR